MPTPPLREAGRYGGGLVPYGYRKAPHPSGSGWCLAPDPETASLVRSLVSEVRSGRSLIALARELNDRGVPVPRDRQAQLQGRRTGGRRHGRDFDHFRWTSGTLSKVLRSPSLKGHRTHGGQTVRDGAGAPVLIGQPLLSDTEFDALQAVLQTRSNGTRRPRRPTSGGVCPAPAGVRSDWLEQYTLDCYRRATGKEAPATREDLLRDRVRVTVAKGRRGGGPERSRGPEASRLTFTIEGRAPQSG